jgi:hypothetical protein
VILVRRDGNRKRRTRRRRRSHYPKTRLTPDDATERGEV